MILAPEKKYPASSWSRHLVAPFACASIALSSSLLGCSSTQIKESELSITPTEPPSSFSRASQTSIESLHLTADRLANPESLAISPEVSGLARANRSLLLSEAWYLRGQNDVEVPIAISLDRFLRAAHFAYDSIFAGDSCADGNNQLCADLHHAYNRASREVARLTNNGTQLPDPSPDAYAIDREIGNNSLELSEWEIYLNEKPNSPGATLGASGAACQTRVDASSPSSSLARLCAPAAFIVAFDTRADDGRSRAHLGVFQSTHTPSISLHDREVRLSSDHHAAWSNLLAPSSAEHAAVSCLAVLEPLLPTVILIPQGASETSEWPLIAAALSSDAHLSEHYNFCVLKVGQTPTTTGEIAGALAAVSSSSTQRFTIVLIAQGPQNDSLAREIKRAVKEGSATYQAPLVVAGSLTVPPPPTPRQEELTVAQAPPSELTKQGQSAVNDSKRLLSKLSDSEDGVFGGVTRRTIASRPGMTISPVM